MIQSISKDTLNTKYPGTPKSRDITYFSYIMTNPTSLISPPNTHKKFNLKF